MINHRHLLSILPKHRLDYAPYGTVERETASKEGDWGPDCSCGCKWAAWLEGELSTDWLVCTNPQSHRCGLLTFEHQGCPEFEGE